MSAWIYMHSVTFAITIDARYILINSPSIVSGQKWRSSGNVDLPARAAMAGICFAISIATREVRHTRTYTYTPTIYVRLIFSVMRTYDQDIFMFNSKSCQTPEHTSHTATPLANQKPLTNSHSQCRTIWRHISIEKTVSRDLKIIAFDTRRSATAMPPSPLTSLHTPSSHSNRTKSLSTREAACNQQSSITSNPLFCQN
jgi:hypothetical protein